MQNKTLTIHWNDEQLPILPVEPEAHLNPATNLELALGGTLLYEMT